jgi:probable phosphoglycerate mutase
VIRHGETSWNIDKRIQGNIDIALNATGEKQVCEVANALANERFDAVFSSDLQRAYETAGAIARIQGLPVRIERSLRERRFGAFEGLTHEEIRVRYPSHYSAWRAREADALFPPGIHGHAETLREFFNRVVNAVTDLVHGNFHKLAIVTHGGVLDCLYRAASGLDLCAPRHFDISNAAINRLVWKEGRLYLLQWGDISHLDVSTLDEIH